MNKRIQELIRLSAVPAEQAEDYALAKGLIEPAEKLDVAKFAELIVKECIWEVVKDNEVPHNIQVLIGERFKEHFGVGE